MGEKEIQDMIDKRDKLREDRGKGLEERNKKEDRKREDMARLRTREEEQRNQVTRRSKKASKRSSRSLRSSNCRRRDVSTSIVYALAWPRRAEERQERKEEEVTPR